MREASLVPRPFIQHMHRFRAILKTIHAGVGWVWDRDKREACSHKNYLLLKLTRLFIYIPIHKLLFLECSYQITEYTSSLKPTMCSNNPITKIRMHWVGVQNSVLQLRPKSLLDYSIHLSAAKVIADCLSMIYVPTEH